MKKLISMLLAIIISMASVSAFAEEFTLHSGTKFGMTRDEVKAIETSKGYTVENTSLKYSFYDTDGEYYFKETNALKIKGSMAGVENSNLYYYFNDNNELFAAVYKFGEFANNNNVGEYFDIQNTLSQKYSENWQEVSASEKYPRIIDCFYNELVQNPTVYSLDMYSIENPDNSQIHINHILCYPKLTGQSDNSCLRIVGEHYLEYRLLSAEELSANEEAMGRKAAAEEEERQAQQRQKADDL